MTASFIYMLTHLWLVTCQLSVNNMASKIAFLAKSCAGMEMKISVSLDS